MASKHRRTIAKEIVDQTISHFEKRQQNPTPTQPQKPSQESERKPSQRFEPTPSFCRVFSENVGKKTRPSANIKLKENPRIINLSQRITQQNKENETEHMTQMGPQESEGKPLKKLEPTDDFYEVFSEIIGKKPHKHPTT